MASKIITNVGPKLNCLISSGRNPSITSPEKLALYLGYKDRSSVQKWAENDRIPVQHISTICDIFLIHEELLYGEKEVLKKYLDEIKSINYYVDIMQSWNYLKSVSCSNQSHILKIKNNSIKYVKKQTRYALFPTITLSDEGGSVSDGWGIETNNSNSNSNISISRRKIGEYFHLNAGDEVYFSFNLPIKFSNQRNFNNIILISNGPRGIELLHPYKNKDTTEALSRRNDGQYLYPHQNYEPVIATEPTGDYNLIAIFQYNHNWSKEIYDFLESINTRHLVIPFLANKVRFCKTNYSVHHINVYISKRKRTNFIRKIFLKFSK